MRASTSVRLVGVSVTTQVLCVNVSVGVNMVKRFLSVSVRLTECGCESKVWSASVGATPSVQKTTI